MSEEDTEPGRPLLRVVRGTPDEFELAALTAVVAAAGSNAGDQPEPRRRSQWADPTTSLRQPVRAGPGAWRASGLPR
ncbi:MAG: acyl-CoA carboxylase subunit epsilon [Pseudonocardiaceae bacterium]